MPKFLVAVSALTTMTGRLTVDAETPEAAAKAAAVMLGGDNDPGWEFVDGGRPAPGSEAVDAVRDETDTDDLFIPPAEPGALAVLADLLPLAESYVEDWSTGLADGTYEESDGLDKAQRAVDLARSLVGAGTAAPAAVPTARQLAESALAHLKTARDIFKLIGADKTLARVRSAISSAKGAVRNAGYRKSRKAAEKIAAAPVGEVHPGWSEADCAAAEGEGWNIFADSSEPDAALSIRADHEYERFVRNGMAYDDEAIAFVKEQAAAGSPVHQRALALHEGYHQPARDPDVGFGPVFDRLDNVTRRRKK